MTRLPWVALLVLLAAPPLTSGAAVAAPPAKAAVEEARDRFNRGVQLYNEGSLEAALAEFQKAYQLAPSYRLHFNIAQVQYELHNYVEALRSFWKYLAQGGAEIPAARRSEVETEIKKLEKRVGYLSIKTNVSGAQISVDGVPMGISPFTAPVLVNPGSRRVTANKAAYVPAQNQVTVAGGEKLELSLQLPPALPVVDTGIELDRRPSPFGAAWSDGPSGRPKTWGSLAVAGAFGISATVFAFVTQNAQNEFDSELSRIPNTRDNIESARSRMTRFAAVTDVLLAATAVATGFTIYFALTETSGTSTPQLERGLSLSATPGGLQLGGRF